MRIDEIDSNLRIDTDITEPDLVWMNVRQTPFQIHGIFFDEDQGCFLRLPQAVATKSNPADMASTVTFGLNLNPVRAKDSHLKKMYLAEAFPKTTSPLLKKVLQTA